METIIYKAFINGAWHTAEVSPSNTVDGYHMIVYTVNYKGERTIRFEKDFKTVPAAKRGLHTHFFAGEWKRV